MMENDLKSRIDVILTDKRYDYKALAHELKLPEYELIGDLEKGALSFRYIEAIAKALQVPLYSLFFTNNAPVHIPGKPYAEWSEQDEDPSPQKLREEIAFIEDLLRFKREQLDKWQG